jgi:6-phosphofructokinase 1
MNACIRAVVRTAIYHELEVVGIRRGYAGMMEGDMMEMDVKSVSNIIQHGGTILKTARADEFKMPEGRTKAIANLKKWAVDGLVAIGGDGTYRGANDLSSECDVTVVGVPATIDNDICGTDFTIGYDTAINIALDAVDRIRDTAASHQRIFFIEVMGRDAGFIALDVAVAGGAEYVLVPEVPTDIDEMCDVLVKGRERGKGSSIVIVAEGDDAGGAYSIAEKVKAKTGLNYRITILGHIQRGGSPTVKDRILASKLGAAAVEALKVGTSDVMAGVVHGKVKFTPLEAIWTQKKEIDMNLHELARILSI